MDDPTTGATDVLPEPSRSGGGVVDLAALRVPALLLDRRDRVLGSHDPAWGLGADGVLLPRLRPGADVRDALPGEDDPAAVLAAGGVVRLQIRRPDGTPCPVDATVVPLADGTRLCTLQVLPPARLRTEAVRILDLAFQTAPIGMAMYDTDGRFVRVNEAMCTLLGHPEDGLIGTRDNVLTHPEDRAADVAAAMRILDGELDTWRTEKRFLTGRGDVVWVIANMTFLRDDGGRPLAWLGQFTDITARKAEEGVWRHRADTDDLTGLASRRRSLEALEAAVPQHPRQRGGAVLALDLDGFKSVNDVEGHAAGDRLLVAIAAALADAVTRLLPDAVVGRMGGDEFVVVGAGATTEQAHATAAACRTAVAAAAAGRVGVSIGIADITAAGGDAALHDADVAMYADKERRARVAHRLGRRATAPPP